MILIHSVDISKLLEHRFSTASLKLSAASHPLCLNSILHVPQLRHNLIFVKQVCCDNSCSVIFNDSSARFKDNTTNEVLL